MPNLNGKTIIDAGLIGSSEWFWLDHLEKQMKQEEKVQVVTGRAGNALSVTSA
tara:strand:+ start:1400 stop:1558 length:159 start_codon:yes stop_codon:yes gene_type:complete